MTFIDAVEAQIGRVNQVRSTVKSKINAAIQHITWEQRPPEMRASTTQVTSDATSSYALGSDVYAIILVRNNSAGGERFLLRPGSIEEFDAMAQDSTATGSPGRWVTEGNNLIIYDAIPDDNSGSNYTLRYRYLKRPTTLSLDADQTDLNAEWDEPTILLASAYMFRALNNEARAAILMGDYRTEVQLRNTRNMIEFEAEDTGLQPFVPIDRTAINQ